MNFDTRPRRVQNIGIGDKVTILRASASSIELYTKLKGRGVKNLHCPCSAKVNEVLEVKQAYGNGFILKEEGNYITCAVLGDIKKL